MPEMLGAAHIGLTVRDMDLSARWYQSVFGWKVIGRFTQGERGTPRVLLYDPQSRFAMSLCQPEDRTGDTFDYRRTGLDHCALAVADEDQLVAWATHLDTLGVAHSPVREVGDLAKFFSFDDPDGIQLEMWLLLKLPTGEPL